ncbi:amino acid adenylation domain-containing protein [Streptomyces sp. NPDC004787]|uniref:amino acid adenylation domain-containing protein n=1 Tax=Streptomyces sp. NPDC004787 TaxID=3154291 RepID=UPI0033ADEE47
MASEATESSEIRISLLQDGKSRDFPSCATVHGLVDHWVKQNPDIVALTAGSESMTYGELGVQASRLAGYLREQGVRPGSRIGVRLPRGVDAVVAFLAVLKSACVYVPLDPNYPPGRLAFMAEDAQLALTITSDMLHESRGMPVERPHEARNETSPPSDVACVIYTSGSTGEPKGVEIRHESIINLVISADYASFDTSTRFLHACSISFDMAIMEIWTPLLHGGRLVISPAHPLSAGELRLVVRGQRVTDAVLPTALFHRQIEDAPDSFRGLRSLMVGGEPLDGKHAAAALESSPGLRLVNGYGPTETLCYCTYHILGRPEDMAGPVTIGRPAANVRVRVLDSDLHPVPVGAVGELFVGGPGLARGYLRRPELTAERFIQDPQDAGLRLYRTGDLVRWCADGTLAFCGRADNQIKLRGHRIEPGEIETVLQGHGSVARAVVVLREDPPGRPHLAAYVTPQGGRHVDLAELREFLAALMPAHMVPESLEVLQTLPLTVNGKVDVGALPAPVRIRDAALGPVVAPRSAVEEALTVLWQEVLGVGEVSANDSFVAVGGDSLAAMRIVTAMEKRFRVQVPLSALLPDGTIASLAGLISHNAQHNSAQAQAPIRPVPRNGKLPATVGQQGLWFHDLAYPGSTVYSEILPLRLRGPLRAEVLRQCIERLVARHEPLRTALVLEGEQLVQRIGPSGVVLAEVSLTSPERGEALDTALAETVRKTVQPFRVDVGPHIRAHLMRVSEQDHLLLLSMHHASMDGFSANLLFEELALLYRALSSDREPDLEPLKVQFADFAAWQHRQLENGEFESEVAYWQAQLADAPQQVQLPTDLPRPEFPSGRGALAWIHLSGELTGRIDRLARTAGVTRFMLLLAAFQILLSRYTGADDIVVGTAASGRTHPDVEHAVGYFVNVLPLRIRIRAGERFTALLARVRSTVLGAYDHQRLPFPALVKACGQGTGSLTPLVQVAMVNEDVYTHAFRLDEGLTAKFEYFDLGISKYDLTLALISEPGGNGLRVSAEYRTDLFRPATIERFLKHFHNLLQSVTSAPDAPVGQLLLAPVAGQIQARSGINAPASSPSTGRREVTSDMVAEP